MAKQQGIDPARRAAYEVVKAVRVDDAYANLVLPQVLRKHRLDGRDAAFATELASGTLRMSGAYDAILDEVTDKPLRKVSAKVLDVLRLGAHQLLAMRVPSHAAIDTSVQLIRNEAGAGQAGFANAVLRQVAERSIEEWLDRVAPGTSTRDLATRYSHPQWVVKELRKALGGKPGELAELLAADNAAPGVTLVARPGRSTTDELPGEQGRMSPYAVHLDSGDPHAVEAVAAGRAGVQDEGSQLVAVALAAAEVAGEDQRWLDLCAGPGGKAALLAALAQERGARLTANEIQAHRVELVRTALGTAAEGVEITGHDGRDTPFAPGSFDKVLVDAPCSGLGALRRRPEARWRRRPSDITDLVPLQGDLVAHALTLVRPGGVVLYATCSPVVAETADVVRAALRGRGDTHVEAITGDWLPADAVAQPDGCVQLWPHRHGTDAMFMAMLRRSG